jgi:predicted metal-dependent phosphoesterase TrpH
MHTRCSDGVWDLARLLDEVRERSLDFFSVSDHDSLDAYPMPRDLDDRVIPALEVDSHHANHTVHLLAYGVSDKSSPLLATLAVQRGAREERMSAMIDAVRKCGIDVSMSDVRAQATGTVSLGRPHLARALVACGAVETVQEAFDHYLADDCNAYVPLERLSSARAIELIRESNGVAVVSHPQRLHNDSDLSELIRLGVDGIEVIHPTADDAAQQRLMELARANGLLVTAGTDFHAPVKGRPIGVPFPAREIERLREAITSRAEQ